MLRPNNTEHAEAPLPAPGKTTVLFADWGEFKSRFKDRFELSYEVVLDPPPANDAHLPERPPVPCRFVLASGRPGRAKPFAVVEQLQYSAEYYAGNRSTFGSGLLDIPKGTTHVTLTNTGCAAGYDFLGGTAHLQSVGEHSMIPVYMDVSRFLGLLLGCIGICLGLLNCAGAALKRYRPSRRSHAG